MTSKNFKVIAKVIVEGWRLIAINLDKLKQ